MCTDLYGRHIGTSAIGNPKGLLKPKICSCELHCDVGPLTIALQSEQRGKIFERLVSIPTMHTSNENKRNESVLKTFTVKMSIFEIRIRIRCRDVFWFSNAIESYKWRMWYFFFFKYYFAISLNNNCDVLKMEHFPEGIIMLKDGTPIQIEERKPSWIWDHITWRYIFLLSMPFNLFVQIYSFGLFGHRYLYIMNFPTESIQIRWKVNIWTWAIVKE